MIRYFAALLVAIVLVVGAQVGVSAYNHERLTKENCYLCSFIAKKVRLARAIAEPKMLLVGGSNVYCGLACDPLAEAIKRPVFNFGMHAALGPDYMLHLAKQTLKPGDAVLIAFEYVQFTADAPNAILFETAHGEDEGWLKEGPLRRKLQFYTSQKPERLFRALKRPMKPVDTPFSTTGEATFNLKSAKTAAMNTFSAAWISPIATQSEQVKSIRDFIMWAHAHDVKVFATWPNAWLGKSSGTPATLARVQGIHDFYSQLGVPVLGNMEELQLPHERFYDTAYHLDDEGVRLHSAQIAGLLKQEWEKSIAN